MNTAPITASSASATIERVGAAALLLAFAQPDLGAEAEVARDDAPASRG
jgi:hypothetical protein